MPVSNGVENLGGNLELSLSEVYEALHFRNTKVPNPIPFHIIFHGKIKGIEDSVIIKRIPRPGRNDGRLVLLAEMIELRRLNHPKIAPFVGFCWEEKQCYIIYNVKTRGTLADFLHGKRRRPGGPLDFCKRMKIAQEVAQGLEYLHNKLNPPVVHVGMKSSNVLLDWNFEAVLCDVNLLDFPTGYFDKEILKDGLTPPSADVYVFGVLLLEIISGKQVFFGENKTPLLDWARVKLMNKEYDSLVDNVIIDGGGYECHRLDRALQLVEMCIRPDEFKRPGMDYVVRFFDVITGFSFIEEDGSPPDSLLTINDGLYI